MTTQTEGGEVSLFFSLNLMAVSKYSEFFKSLCVCRERTRDEKKREREEDEEDVYERRRLERRLRDKEAAYQDVLLQFFVISVCLYISDC